MAELASQRGPCATSLAPGNFIHTLRSHALLENGKVVTSCGIERQALPLQYMVRLSMLPVQGGHSFKRRAP